jgi:hypothetical protein
MVPPTANCHPASLTVGRNGTMIVGDERDRNQNERGEGQRGDEAAGEHAGVTQMRE